ncbi:hypothetical protein [Cohaesibacter intestini]|nr:hypothetical protein [Cohaesibacter intestini]
MRVACPFLLATPGVAPAGPMPISGVPFAGLLSQIVYDSLADFCNKVVGA